MSARHRYIPFTLSFYLTNTRIQEDGVGTAIKTVYRDLDYAKSLIKQRAHVTNDDNADEEWTLIGDEDDPELIRRIQEYDPAMLSGGARKSFQLGGGKESLDLGA